MWTEVGLARQYIGVFEASIGSGHVGDRSRQGKVFDKPGGEGCTRVSTPRPTTIVSVWGRFRALGAGIVEPGRDQIEGTSYYSSDESTLMPH